MAEIIDPLANVFNEKVPKDINDFRNILEEAIESSGANKNLPEIGNFLTEVEISEKEDHSLTTDIHIPKGEGPFPILVYFHGVVGFQAALNLIEKYVIGLPKLGS